MSGAGPEVPLRIPKLGLAMTEGTLVTWLVEEGALVDEGDPVYVVETDKVETEVTAPASGRVIRLGVEGTTYEVGAEIGRLTAP